jgi:prepilin-type N-terminal cleavage/methylation domain-containing protein
MSTLSQPGKGRFRNGFTLIELLVVIAIIAILTAILLPVLAKAKEKALQTECISNYKQIGVAVQIYVEDFSGYFPIASYTDPSGNNIVWTKALGPYLPQQGNKVTSVENKVFICPSANFKGPLPNGISRSCACTGTMLGLNPPPSTSLTATLARKATPLLTPSETLVAVEAKQESPLANPPSDFSYSNIQWNSSTAAAAKKDLALANNNLMTALDFRHNVGKNMVVLYADTSVRSTSFLSATNRWTQTLWENR